jgi:hypothetical protein
MTQVRIYYECLEQAQHYIRPIVEKAASRATEIFLVKRPRYASQLPEGSVSAVQSLTTPDILITGIVDNKEYPLLLIEFTEAVTTEDHELQRTYGAVSAYLSVCYYIKVSGQKESTREHGGAEYNPYSTPKILIEKLGYEGYVIADWSTQQGAESVLLRDTEFPGCPPKIQLLEDTILSAVSSFLNNPAHWYEDSLRSLKKTATYQSFRTIVNSATSSDELLETWKSRQSNNTDRNRLRFFVRKKSIAAKINRFSHAMDPDRGILIFLSFVFSSTHKVYGIYALVRQRSLQGPITSLSTLRTRLSAALKKDAGGIPSWFTQELKKVAGKAKTLNDEIDIQHIWEKHQHKITKNKVVSTVAFFLDGIFLNHNGIKLVWDRRKLLGNTNGDFHHLLRSYFGFANNTPPAGIREVLSGVDEDEVTYAITHRVLIPNKFRIVSVSYPGSQGSGAILPNREEGRSQPREYPDIIALPPKQIEEFDVLLNESKGMFNQAQLNEAVHKLEQYKSNPKYLNAVTELLIAVRVIDPHDTIRNILIGVAFGTDRNSKTSWNPGTVDFIFRIVQRSKWSIGIFNQSLRDLIPTISGETSFPKVFTIVSKSAKGENQSELFE